MEEPESSDDQNSIKWMIRENKDWSGIVGVRRQDSTLQKSWCVIKSHDLPEELSIAIIGHKGWEQDLEKRLPYSLAVSFECISADIPVYQMIEVANRVEVPLQVEVTV